MEWRKTGLETFSFKTRHEMAKFKPIKKLGTGLARWKEKKLEKKGENGITNPKKDKKEWKDSFQEREKSKKLEKERSFLKGNAFLSIPVPANFR